MLSKFLEQEILRQTPGSTGVWGQCQFHINASGQAFDRVVVFDTLDTPRRVICPADGTLMLVGEPPEIKTYNRDFLAQFARVVTQDSNCPHPGVIDSHAGQPWFVGIATEPGKPKRVTMTYDDLVAARPEKTGLLSITVGRTAQTEGHKMRMKMADALRARLGDAVAVFGRDVNRVADKWDALAPFKYHVALENSRYNHYWTEKLSDPYLADCFAFYWGCPDIADYFNPTGFQAINIYDPQGAAEVIADAIDAEAYEKSKSVRERDRQRVLNEYNLFALLDRVLAEPVTEPAAEITIRPESHYLDSRFRKFRKRLRRAVPRSVRPKRWKV